MATKFDLVRVSQAQNIYTSMIQKGGLAQFRTFESEAQMLDVVRKLLEHRHGGQEIEERLQKVKGIIDNEGYQWHEAKLSEDLAGLLGWIEPPK